MVRPIADAPQGISILQGDIVRFNGRTSATSITIRLTLNIVSPDGRPFSTALDHSPPDSTRGAGTPASKSLDAGTIVSAAIDILGGTNPVQPGIIYCEAYLQRSGSTIAQLIGDWQYAGHTPQYPGEIISMSDHSKPGAIRIIQTANPAAGSEVAAQAVPTSAKWRVRSYTVQMVQGVTQTPRPALEITDGTNRLALVPLSADIAASTTVDCTWGLELDTVTNNVDTGSMATALPDMILPAAATIATSTQGIGAASDYGAASITVEEWFAG